MGYPKSLGTAAKTYHGVTDFAAYSTPFPSTEEETLGKPAPDAHHFLAIFLLQQKQVLISLGSNRRDLDARLEFVCGGGKEERHVHQLL